MSSYICDEITGLEMTALGWVKKYSEMDMTDIDPEELGAVVDILKDLFQTEKYIHESRYYKMKCEGMTEEDESEPVGMMNKMSTHM